MAARRGNRLHSAVPLAVFLWGLAMGVLALAALLGTGVPIRDKSACRDAGGCPPAEFEGWLVAGAYVGAAGTLGLAVILFDDVHLRRSYRRWAVAAAALSLLLAWKTPRAWMPVRATFVVGAVGLIACLPVGDALRREAAAEAAWLDGLLAADRAAEDGPEGDPAGDPGEALDHGPRDFGGGGADN